MLEKIISFSIRNKLIIGLFTLALIVYGVYAVTKLPIDAVPDITNNQVQVITVSPSLGAPDVERLITFPIEQANSNIPGIHEIRSFSRFGLSLVTIVFNDGVDVYWARQQVSERLQEVKEVIPAGAGLPSLAPVTTGLGEIYQYVVKPKPGYEGKFTATELRTIQDWMVRRQLLGTEGVADVSSFGGLLKQYEVAVNPARLKSFNLTIADVFNALESNNQNTGGSYIEKGPTVLFIRSEGLVGSISDIENIVVKNTDTKIPVLIRDVADVRIGAATRYGAMCYNADGEVAGAVVMMLKGANSSAVIKRVKERMAQIQKTLPEGVMVEPFLDRTKMVNNAISTVETNLLEGALIVLFVLVFFLANIRAGLLVASIIPLAMLFAVVMMNLFGVSGNLMSLGAIDFGLIVDGAVIIVEAIMHQLTHSKHFKSVNLLSQTQMDEEVHHSSSRMMNSAVFGQIIILIVYLPILSLEGIEGKMFGPMAQTVSFAILGAMILSLTYLPMISALVISKKIKHKATISDRMMNVLERWYQRALEKVLLYKKTVLFTAVGLFGISMFILSTLGGEFIPQLEEGDFAVECRLLPGTNLNVSINTTQQAAKILLDSFPEVEKVVTKIGSGEIPTDPMPIEMGDMMVILKPKKEWTSAKTFPDLAEKMSAALEAVPGLKTGFQFPVQMRFNELMTGARQDVVVKIFGEDLDTLAYYAQKLGTIVETVEGAKDLYVESVTGMPQIIVNYKRDAIAKFGLNISDVNRTLNAAFAGQSTGMVYEGEKRFDLVVRVGSEMRKDLNDVQNLLIATPSGAQVPLYQVADVNIVEGPNQIQREETKRRIVVGFNVRGRDVQTIVDELHGKIEKQIKFPAGYYVTYGGTFENLQAAKQRLSVAVPIALLLIFLLLYFAIGTIGESILIYTAIPLSAIGGILVLWLRGMNFSISAGVGFIALFGVAVLNGIVLIAEFKRLKKEGWTDVRKIVIQGTKIRLRSVLMTALAPSLGFIPMAVSTGAGAEVQRPLATVVIGGIVSAALLTLFVLPILYVLYETFMERRIKRSAATIATLVALVFAVQFADAQQSISLEQALSVASKNNLTLRSAQLNEQANEKLKRSYLDVNKTEVIAEYGQINTVYNDTRFGIAQGFSFPGVYVQQKKVLNENYRMAQSETKITELETRTAVKSLYYQVLNLREKQKLLLFADSIYNAFLQKATQRYEKGETNLLEKTTAAASRSQIANQLQMLKSDLSISLQQFNRLLNDSVFYEPEVGTQKYLFTSYPDTSQASANPLLAREMHRMNVLEHQWKLERNKLAPDFNLGYYNTSFIGWQKVDNTDVYFNASKRFNMLSAGISIPLFFSGQAAKIASAKKSWLKAQNDFAVEKQKLNTAFDAAVANVKKYEQSLAYYESAVLNNANTIIETANKQFAAGEISYIEWTMLLNQSIGIKSEYTDLVYQYNQSVFELEKISGKQ
ncbi:MAG: CusA/CzcA family heavy metal efflux RND transporter [Chitinophagales bacterium]|nr:CusA/CzcA family heavy metal efflux RND transporter [Chitinophagales bacterium]